MTSQSARKTTFTVSVEQAEPELKDLLFLSFLRKTITAGERFQECSIQKHLAKKNREHQLKTTTAVRSKEDLAAADPVVVATVLVRAKGIGSLANLVRKDALALINHL
jgi:hypothetical protein